jgi:hypothetical protein
MRFSGIAHYLRIITVAVPVGVGGAHTRSELPARVFVIRDRETSPHLFDSESCRSRWLPCREFKTATQSSDLAGRYAQFM